MDVQNLGLNDWVTCPYDPVHRLKYSKFYNHFVKCRANHPDDIRKPCPYNYSELIKPEDYDNHILNCIYKKLYVHSSDNSQRDLPQYDAPCHLKFGPSVRSVKNKSDNVDSEYGDGDVPMEDVDSVSVYEHENYTESFSSHAGSHISFDNDDVKSNANIYSDDDDARVSSPKPEPIELPERKGFGRGAFFKKLRMSKELRFDET